jgi:hypothetical protein
MPLNLTDEAVLRLTVGEINQIIGAVNSFYTGLIGKVVTQVNNQSEADKPPARPFTNGPQASVSE